MNTLRLALVAAAVVASASAYAGSNRGVSSSAPGINMQSGNPGSGAVSSSALPGASGYAPGTLMRGQSGTTVAPNGASTFSPGFGKKH